MTADLFNPMPAGSYRYVKIDLTDIKHIKSGEVVYLKDPATWEVTTEPIGQPVGLCLPEMDIDDTDNYPQCTWPRWIAWLWRLFNPVKQYKKGPIRYFFVRVSNMEESK